MKYFFTILCVSIFSLSSFSQMSIVAETDTIFCSIDGEAHYKEFVITNNALTEKTLKWEMDISQMLDGWVAYLCTEITCYGPNTTASPASEVITIAADGTYTIKFYFEANETEGAELGDISPTIFSIKEEGGQGFDDQIEMVGVAKNTSSISLITDGSLSIAPTAVEDIIVVKNTELDRQLGTLQLTTIAGQRVLETALNNEQSLVQVGHLETGIYLATVTDENGRILFAEKVIKQ